MEGTVTICMILREVLEFVHRFLRVLAYNGKDTRGEKEFISAIRYREEKDIDKWRRKYLKLGE